MRSWLHIRKLVSELTISSNRKPDMLEHAESNSKFFYDWIKGRIQEKKVYFVQIAEGRKVKSFNELGSTFMVTMGN